MASPEADYTYYHPDCFVYLKCWQGLMNALWSSRPQSLSSVDIERACQEMETDSLLDARILYDCLESLGVEKALAHARTHGTTEGVYNRHLHHWFDAFRTLKFIHWLRDNHLPSVPMSCLTGDSGLPFTNTSSDVFQGNIGQPPTKCLHTGTNA